MLGVQLQVLGEIAVRTEITLKFLAAGSLQELQSAVVAVDMVGVLMLADRVQVAEVRVQVARLLLDKEILEAKD